MADRQWWEPRTKALHLTHYRTEDSTYVDTRLWQADIVELGWEAQYVWFRMLSGPEYEQEGFPAHRLHEVFARPQEVDYQTAVESLLRARLITQDEDYYRFPNVVWGPPPEDEED